MVTRRFQIIVVVSLLVVAIGVSVWLSERMIASRKAKAEEIANLILKLTGPEAEAIEAFEQMKKLPDDSLWDLIPFADSDEDSPLDHLSYSYEDGGSVSCTVLGKVSNVVGFILTSRTSRLTRDMDHLFNSSRPRRDIWPTVLKEYQSRKANTQNDPLHKVIK
jgi:hypothetical protein